MKHSILTFVTASSISLASQAPAKSINDYDRDFAQCEKQILSDYSSSIKNGCSIEGFKKTGLIWDCMVEDLNWEEDDILRIIKIK